MEAYSDSFYTTGVTYQADNQPTPTTVKGAGVDVSVMPIIGLSGRIDWGVHAYDAQRHQRDRPAQRRHRRHRQLRHHPQRARPAVRRDRGLAAGHLRRPGRAVRAGRLRHRRGRALRRRRAVRARRRRLLRPGQPAEHLRHRVLGAADRLHRPRRGRPPAGPRRWTRTCWSPTRRPTGECISSFMQEIQFAPYADRPGHAGRQFRRGGQRQLRLRRRVLPGDARRRPTRRDPACSGGRA